MIKDFKVCKVCNSDFQTVNTKHQLVCCINCNLVFSKRQFTDDEFVETYNRLYNTSNQYKVHIKQYEDLLSGKHINIGYLKKKVLKLLLENNVKKVAEVGAGIGMVGHYLNGKKVDYLGIELDAETSLRAQKLNLNVIQGDFKCLDTFEEKFDAIVAFEVMEHLQDLDAYFKIIQNKIKVGGFLGFTVPNYDKRLNYTNPKDNLYQSGPPVHLNFFTIKSLNAIALRYGFSVILCYEKKFPYFTWKKITTYKFFFKALFSKYYGSTLIGIWQKND